MAKQPRIKKVSGDSNKTQLVVQQLVQVTVDRSMKDVGKLITALRAAESIYYPNRTQLYDLYSSFVDLDAHLNGIINKRISAVLNKDWRFVIDEKNVEEVDKRLINTNTFRNIIRGIMLSKFWGITGFEFIPGTDIDFEDIPRKHIKPESGIITTNQSDQEGIAYKNISNIFIVGDKKDYGLFLTVAFVALLKKGDFADWAQYVEIFGQPFRVAKYDAFDLKTKEQLTDALLNAGSSLALMIPKQAEFEVIDGKVSNGNGDLQNKLLNACNNEMDVAILGNTETTGNTNGGSNAKAQEQGKQQLEITADDIAFVRNILNTPKFIEILKSYGLPVEGGMFTVEKEINPAELLINSQVDQALKNIGVPLDDDYFYNAYNRPKPANYDALKKEHQQAAQQAQAFNEDDPDEDKPAPKNKPPKSSKNANLGFWDRFKNELDFFA